MGKVTRIKGRKYWYITYVDANGKQQLKSSRTTDKTAANQLLVAMEIHAVQTRAGVRSTAGDKASEFAKQPIQKRIDDFANSLQSQHGQANKHVADTKIKIEKILAEQNIRTGGDLTADALEAYSTKRQKAEDLSARTIQSYIVAAKAFAKWSVDSGRLLSNPLSRVKSPSPAKDRRHERRALSRDEWHRIRIEAIAGPDRRRIPGPQRALLYELALVTGLRAKEIDGLTRASVVLDGKSPYIMLPSAATKNKKAAEQMLTPRLAELLAKHVGLKHRGASLFGIMDLNRLAIVLRADMEAARVKWIKEVKTVDEQNARDASDFLKVTDSEGKNIDFHALRYTCGAWLALGGIHAKQIQKMMRHSTIRLTLDTYGHLFPEQQDHALNVLKEATAC